MQRMYFKDGMATLHEKGKNNPATRETDVRGKTDQWSCRHLCVSALSESLVGMSPLFRRSFPAWLPPVLLPPSWAALYLADSRFTATSAVRVC